MSEELEAAKRVSCLMPKDIRALDDESTLKLISDLATIGTGISAGKHVHDLKEARSVMSRAV